MAFTSGGGGRSGGSTFSVFGSDLVIRGDVQASVDLHIDGRVEGDITCASLVQGSGSVISGAIAAETARLAGTVTGSISAGELIVEATARITGDVAYDSIVIEQGGQVDGKFVHRSAAQAAAQRGQGEGARILDLATLKTSDDEASMIAPARNG